MSLNKSYSGKIESLNETNAAVYRIEKKLDFISTSSSEMIIDKRLDFELIETIVNHFKAYEEENWELFIETINSLDEQWKEDYEDYSGGKYIIRKIAPVDHVIEPFFVEVIMDKDSDPFGFHLSVSRVDGKWKINMYD